MKIFPPYHRLDGCAVIEARFLASNEAEIDEYLTNVYNNLHLRYKAKLEQSW